MEASSEMCFNNAADLWAQLHRTIEILHRNGELRCDFKGVGDNEDDEDDDDGHYKPTAEDKLWSAFWGAHQRFFKELCVAAKVPAVVQQAKLALSQNKCVVIGLLGTGEARADAAREEFGDEFDDFVSAPLATLIHFIKRCFHLPPEKLEEIEDFNMAPLGKSSAKRAERVDGDTEDLVKSKTRVRLTYGSRLRVGRLTAWKAPFFEVTFEKGGDTDLITKSKALTSIEHDDTFSGDEPESEEDVHRHQAAALRLR